MGYKFDSFLCSAKWDDRLRNDAFDIFGKEPGTILAGGSFTTPFQKITNWNGALWGASGTFNDTVNDILYHSGMKKIFVVGVFTTVNGASIRGVTSTTKGSTYNDLGWTAGYGTPTRLVYDDGSNILAAYCATNAPVPKRYNGSAWSDLPTSNWRYNTTVSSFCNDFIKHGTNYIACGDDSTYLGLAVAWGNSGGWLYISPYTDTIWELAQVISFNGDLYATYHDWSLSVYGFKKWLGTFNHKNTDWSADIDTIHVDRMFEFNGKIIGIKPASPYLVYSDGVNPWATYAGGVNNVVRAMCEIGGELYVVGDFTQVGGSVSATRAAIYNTSSGWRAMSTGLGATPYAIGGFVS